MKSPAAATCPEPARNSPLNSTINTTLKRLYWQQTKELQAALKRADEVAPLKEEIQRLRKANAALTAKCDNMTLWGAEAPPSGEIARLQARVARLTKQLLCHKQDSAFAAARHNSTVEELRRRLDVKGGRLEAAEKTATFFERKAAQYMSEVRHLHRELSVSFEALVREDVFRAIESTGNAAYFPKSLMPTLASMQDAVAAAALQRREQRLKDPECHPLGLHPGVHENGTLVGSAMFPFSPEPDSSDCDCDV